ncbi:MAG: RNA chaperone Hfq [Alphaproteobacteria bacterium]
MSKKFLDKIKEDKISVTLFLMTGIKLQGHLIDYTDDTILLKRDGHIQLIYTHSISTIMPASVVEI